MQSDQSDLRELASEIDKFYDDVLRMDPETFYRKYRDFHKEIVAQGSQETLLGYLRDIKDCYESKTNFDIQTSLKKISSRVWQVPLIIGLISVLLVYYQIYQEKRADLTIADMVSPPLAFEQYFPPDRIVPYQCTESIFTVVNFGQSYSKYRITVKGNGFLISEKNDQRRDGEMEKTWEWAIPPNNKYSITFFIWVNVGNPPQIATLKIEVIDLKKRITLFKETYRYEKFEVELQPSESEYWYLLI